jgi:hypothetical protein
MHVSALSFHFSPAQRTEGMTKPLATKELRFRESIHKARSNAVEKGEKIKELLSLESVSVCSQCQH